MTMNIEATYTETRWAACADCKWSGDTDIDIVVYYDIERGEWVCPECEAVNEYKNDMAWNGNDKHHDTMREDY
jgi:transcription initiation factor TFIIIB Brf1 subunit/transcription initiation factor TFIIB